MYTMVLMMAVTSGGEVSSFGHRNKGCNGDGASCQGVVAVAAPAGCNGSYAAVDNGSCQGGGKSRGGFLGLRNKSGRKGGNSCQGGDSIGGACYGNAYNGGVYNGGGSCHGGVVAAPDCGGCPPVVYGAAPVTGGTTPPVIMPKVEDPKVLPKKEDPKLKDKTESN